MVVRYGKESVSERKIDIDKPVEQKVPMNLSLKIIFFLQLRAIFKRTLFLLNVFHFSWFSYIHFCFQSSR